MLVSVFNFVEGLQHYTIMSIECNSGWECPAIVQREWFVFPEESLQLQVTIRSTLHEHVIVEFDTPEDGRVIWINEQHPHL